MSPQVHLSAEFSARAAHLEPGEDGAPGCHWGPVCIEPLTFDDPEIRLPAIDRVEGLLPDGPSPYRRVLVPASTRGQCVLVWLYVEGAGLNGRLKVLKGGIWR